MAVKSTFPDRLGKRVLDQRGNPSPFVSPTATAEEIRARSDRLYSDLQIKHMQFDRMEQQIRADRGLTEQQKISALSDLTVQRNAMIHEWASFGEMLDDEAGRKEGRPANGAGLDVPRASNQLAGLGPVREPTSMLSGGGEVESFGMNNAQVLGSQLPDRFYNENFNIIPDYAHPDFPSPAERTAPPPAGLNYPTEVRGGAATPRLTGAAAADTIGADAVAEARTYLKSTMVRPGNTVTKQGINSAIDHLHPTLALNAAATVRQARAEGIELGASSAYRPPSYGVSGWGPGKAGNSLHGLGVALDFNVEGKIGLKGVGKETSARIHAIADANGLYGAYGPNHRKEWNHFATVPGKISTAKFYEANPELKGLMQKGKPLTMAQMEKVWAATDVYAKPIDENTIKALNYKSVADYQEKKGLKVDGIIGADTRKAVVADLSGIDPAKPDAGDPFLSARGGPPIPPADIPNVKTAAAVPAVAATAYAPETRGTPAERAATVAALSKEPVLNKASNALVAGVINVPAPHVRPPSGAPPRGPVTAPVLPAPLARPTMAAGAIPPPRVRPMTATGAPAVPPRLPPTNPVAAAAAALQAAKRPGMQPAVNTVAARRAVAPGQAQIDAAIAPPVALPAIATPTGNRYVQPGAISWPTREEEIAAYKASGRDINADAKANLAAVAEGKSMGVRVSGGPDARPDPTRRPITAPPQVTLGPLRTTKDASVNVFGKEGALAGASDYVRDTLGLENIGIVAPAAAAPRTVAQPGTPRTGAYSDLNLVRPQPSAMGVAPRMSIPPPAATHFSQEPAYNPLTSIRPPSQRYAVAAPPMVPETTPEELASRVMAISAAKAEQTAQATAAATAAATERAKATAAAQAAATKSSTAAASSSSSSSTLSKSTSTWSGTAWNQETGSWDTYSNGQIQ